MADESRPFPYGLQQNPSPVMEAGQEFQEELRALTERIMAQFHAVLPSNYVAQVRGPFYTLQFQSAAEQLARIQLAAQQVGLDRDFDFTRPEFLWQILGDMVFPASTEPAGSAPTVDGDKSYRSFLQSMVLLLLRGATPSVQSEGAGLLTEASVSIVEKFLGARDAGSAWDIDNQFEFEVNVEKGGGTDFPLAPFVLQKNVRIILAALKPAHALYEYRHLFREVVEVVSEDQDTWGIDTYYYDDLRKYCLGAKEVTGSAGETMTDRTLFRDPSRSFRQVAAGAWLVVAAGTNAGRYRVKDIIPFPVGDDTVARAYTTSPTGLAGTAIVSGDTLTDTSQNWANAVEGETVTITEGSNKGTYLLDVVLGAGGGPVGTAVGPATAVRVYPSLLRLERRLPVAATGQAYTVTVDRLGASTPKAVSAEDASAQFYL